MVLILREGGVMEYEVCLRCDGTGADVYGETCPACQGLGEIEA